MSQSISLFFQILFSAAFVITLLAGVYLIKNDAKFFGQHPDISSDTAGARAYNRVQIYSIWAHLLLLTGAFALFLH